MHGRRIPPDGDNDDQEIQEQVYPIFSPRVRRGSNRSNEGKEIMYPKLGVQNHVTLLETENYYEQIKGDEEEVNCPECFETYGAKTVVPVALPNCGHTFCRSCLVKLQESQDDLSCPKCRSNHQTHDAKRLATNHSMLEVIKENKKIRNEMKEMTSLLGEMLYRTAMTGDLIGVKKGLSGGISVNYQNRNGWTPLKAACFKGHLHIVQELLNSKADIDLSDENGETPIYVASAEGHLVVVEELLKAGANKDKKTKHGKTPLETATDWGHEDVVQALLYCDSD